MSFPRDLNMQRYGGSKKIHGVARPPLRTLHEMADEFGVSAQSLANTINRDASAPQSQLKHANGAAGQRTVWYEPKALRRWWQARQAPKEPA